MRSDLKIEAVLNRINGIESDIAKAREYLKNGSHAHWQGFRPLFKEKLRDGKVVPPHKDWVKNVFIPGREKALRKAEKLFDKLEGNE